MLVLTQKVNDSFTVGEATITIVRLGGDKVRIGIEAPRDVPVVRRNAKHKIKRADLAEAAA